MVDTLLTAPRVDYSWAPPLVEHPLGEGRRLRVVGIGAGFSGINLALHLRENVRSVDVTIYDLASDVGGVCEYMTWSWRRRDTLG